MIATVWRFRVRAEHVAAFERVYGPAGDWAKLFAKAPGYAGTKLLKQDGEPGTYLTLDLWRDDTAFVASKELLQGDYAALDRRCEAYTCEETWLGLYRIVD